ncbi:MAG: dynamin family protein [Acinetobacter sp.]|nr:dynamin family protein [Acinetobacter sp.]
MTKPTIDTLYELITPAIPLKLIFNRQYALHLMQEIRNQINDFSQLKQQFNVAQHDIEQLNLSKDNLLQENNQQAKQIAEQADQLNNLQQNLDKNIAQQHHLTQQIEDNQKKFNDQLKEIELRQNLIAQLLSAQSKNQGVKNFFDALYNDFLNFANQENAFKEEAQAMLELQSIGNELKLIGAYPEFHKKHTIAVAGGFSAGKSEFISSLFLDHTIHLPIAIEPTTAIPTYVFHEKTNDVIGCSKNGGIVKLLDIDSDFHHKLSHQFIRSFGFNLKKIMPFVFLTTPMVYENLCFIDTPGYNPAEVAEGHTHEDENTAKEFVKNAKALIWVIGLDANGTISKSDLEFLSHICEESDKPLYIILNKADLRPADQLEDILEEIADTLDDYDISYKGISAYSSIHRREYDFKKINLNEFLYQFKYDHSSNKHDVMSQRLLNIGEQYKSAILNAIQEKKNLNSALKRLRLDLLQAGVDTDTSDVYERIREIQKPFNTDKEEKLLQQLITVFAKFSNAIDETFAAPKRNSKLQINSQEIKQMRQTSSKPSNMQNDVVEKPQPAMQDFDNLLKILKVLENKTVLDLDNLDDETPKDSKPEARKRPWGGATREFIQRLNISNSQKTLNQTD